jgi:hypothetical protein
MILKEFKNEIPQPSEISRLDLTTLNEQPLPIAPHHDGEKIIKVVKKPSLRKLSPRPEIRLSHNYHEALDQLSHPNHNYPKPHITTSTHQQKSANEKLFGLFKQKQFTRKKSSKNGGPSQGSTHRKLGTFSNSAVSLRNIHNQSKISKSTFHSLNETQSAPKISYRHTTHASSTTHYPHHNHHPPAAAAPAPRGNHPHKNHPHSSTVHRSKHNKFLPPTNRQSQHRVRTNVTSRIRQDYNRFYSSTENLVDSFGNKKRGTNSIGSRSFEKNFHVSYKQAHQNIQRQAGGSLNFLSNASNLLQLSKLQTKKLKHGSINNQQTAYYLLGRGGATNQSRTIKPITRIPRTSL